MIGKIAIMASLIAMQNIGAGTIDAYFGTYTKNTGSEGIYHSSLNLESGELSEPELSISAPNPSFIEIHPNSKFLYAVEEGNPGSVGAFEIDRETRKLRLLNKSSSGGNGPCHLCIAKDGKTLLVANYNSGSVAAIPINADGSLAEATTVIQHSGSGINRQHQKGPHAHSVNLSPDNRFAYVADLGLDKIMIYGFDPGTGRFGHNKTSEIKIKAGAGPRHFTLSSDGRFAYVINELDETIVAFSCDSISGGLSEIQTISSLPDDYKGESYCAEIKIHPGGKFLYGSNRGHDSIAIYSINQENGRLALLGFQTSGIKTPRNFNIDPSGRFCLVANQDSDTVIVFRINERTGALESTKHSVKIHSPVSVRFNSK